jgi:hypothetical protein
MDRIFLLVILGGMTVLVTALLLALEHPVSMWAFK